MARRITIPILFACFLFAGSGAQAQVWAPGPNSGGTIPEMFSFTRSGQPNRIQYGGPTDAAVPLNYATPQTAVPGQPYYGSDGIVTTRAPIEPDWTEASPFEATVSQILTRSWYRLEWLSWTIDDPANFTVPPAVIDPVDLEFRNNDGLRGTIGIPLRAGVFEFETFVLNQASDQSRAPRSDDTSILNEVLWTGDFWGSQANLILDDGPDVGIRLSPILGFRYLNLRETMETYGPTRLDSNVQNNHYGPQVGLRAQFVHPRVTLGADAKIALSYNTYKAQLQNPAAFSFISENGTKFAPVGELGVSARVKMTDWLSLFVSGNFLWMNAVSRPHVNVRIPTGSSPRLNALFDDTQIYGITLGGQITLP